MSKARFFGTFLLCFAVLLVVWRLLPAVGGLWRAGIVAAGGSIGAIVHGWVLRAEAGGLFWVHGEARVPLSLQFDALGAALIPTFALLLATPEMPWRDRCLRCAVAGLGLFVTQASVVLLFPLLVFYKNAFTDVLGVFLGMVSFVGAPAILWFLLTLDYQKRWLAGLRGSTN